VERRIKSIGGIVLYADHAGTLVHWYERHLGLHFQREPGSSEWWSEFPNRTSFAIHQAKHPLGHERRQIEITWCVVDLDALLEGLCEMGVAARERQETVEGDFAWLDDPEGNRVELWQRNE